MNQRYFLLPLFLLIVFLSSAQNASLLTGVGGFAGIRGQVFNSVDGTTLPARVIVRDGSGTVQQSYYKNLPGIFTEEDGRFEIPLAEGNYTLKVLHSIDFLSQEFPFSITADQGAEAKIFLHPWVELRSKGWINGEAHAHLYTEKKPDNEMLAGVRKICRAQGIDFISAAQGWAGATDDTWKESYSGITDGKFRMYYGAEMPKYRTGHTYWIGLKSTRGYFWNLMDTVYENSYYQSLTGTQWDFNKTPFPNFTDIEFVPRFARSQNAAAIVAHPTRWWMQERGEISKYTNNAAANMAFNLLSQNLWDGLVVMGDSKDNYSYQNFWFHILNEGYRMPALSELDGGYTPEHKYPYGLMRTYFLTEPKNQENDQGIVDAIRRGRTFITSGPVIFADVDGRFQIGDIIPADGSQRKLNVDVYASGDSEDFLSYVIVFRNGKILRQWDLRKEKPRRFQQSVNVSEKERAWYVVKAYGKQAWENPENLEVMTWFDKHTEEERKEHDVCMTSPLYFDDDDAGKPVPMRSEVDLTLKPARNARVEVLHLGELLETINVKNGKGKLVMPVNAILKITAEGQAPVYRGLYMDYEPHRKLLETLANGTWREKPEHRGKIFPGYIPWSAFNFDETRKLLRRVKWVIDIDVNERDRQWENFEAILKAPE